MIFSLAARLLFIIAVAVAGFILIFTGNTLLGFIIHLAGLGIILYGTLNPSTQIFGEIQTSCDHGVWLTIDDGPDPHDTPAILDLLDRYQAKATFFIIGKNAQAHPELVREIIKRGHQIGNHTQSHPQSLFWALGPWRTFREITLCQKTFREISGENSTLFRAPVGHYNFFVHPILKAKRLRLIGWSHRGFDTQANDAEATAKLITKDVKNGSIILAHEGTLIARELIEKILLKVAEKDLEIRLPDEPPQS